MSPEQSLPPPLEAPSPGPSTMPGIVLAAAILWMAFGALDVMMLLMVAGNKVVPVLLGAGFIAAGVGTVSGKTPQIYALGVISIIFGAVGELAGLQHLLHSNAGLILVVLYATPIVAGVLALVGRDRYVSWRARTNR